MSNLSIRLPDELETGLDREAKLLHKKRSDVVREAIAEYLAHRQQERLMEQMIEETRQLANHAETQDIEDEFANADSSLLEEEPIGEGTWWK